MPERLPNVAASDYSDNPNRIPEWAQARRSCARPIRENHQGFPSSCPPARGGGHRPWVIIGRLVTLVAQRLAATPPALGAIAIAAVNVLANALPDSTCVTL